ncbi:MAG: TonB-dependent receptor [Bacteroidetes bacterium]|nr:TonB-dependent receptor [Bacteroidota bacterium]
MTRIATWVLCFITSQAIAQTRISGTIRDGHGESLPGANIFISDSYDGTSSTADGTFSFSTEETGKRMLQVTSIGYVHFEMIVELTGQDVKVEPVLQEEVSELDAVVISAGSYTAGEEKRRTVLKPLDIATTAGATADIAGALNSLPGTQKVGESGRLFVRGGDGSEARTFVDGMLVLNSYSPSAPNTPSRGRFLPFMFKGTSFSTGGYSAEYGQALSSALVLNSKDKAELNQTDIGLLSVGADVAHTQVWDKGSWSGKVQYTNLRPYMNVINQRVDWINPTTSLEGTTAFRQEMGKGMIKAFASVSQTDFSLYRHSILDPNFKQAFDLSNRYRYGNLSYKTELSNGWGLRGGVAYSYNRNEIGLDGNPAEETEEGTHVKLVGERSLSRDVEWHIGAEVIDRDYSATRYNDTIRLTLSKSFHESIAAAFTEAEVLISRKLVTKVGLRYEYNSLQQTSGTDPRASLAFKPGKRGQFSLAYGIFRQSAPNAYLSLAHQLGPSRAEHLILNYQILADQQTFRVEAYYKRYSNLIKFNNGDPGLINNAGYGYARGFEVFWRDNKSLRNVDYWVSYSYLDTQRDYMNYPMAAVPTFASAHNLSVVYKHFIKAVKSQVGLTYSYASPRTYYNPNQPGEKFLSDHTPSYHDLSVNISYLPKNWLILYASCTNLMGRDNIFGYEYSTAADASGQFPGRAIRQPATHFMFLGVFITLSKNKSMNQLPNL